MKANYKNKLVRVLLTLCLALTGTGVHGHTAPAHQEVPTHQDSATDVFYPSEIYPVDIMSGDFESWFDRWREVMEFGGLADSEWFGILIITLDSLDHYRSGSFIEPSKDYQIVLQLLAGRQPDEQMIDVCLEGLQVTVTSMLERKDVTDCDTLGFRDGMPMYSFCYYSLGIDEFDRALKACLVDSATNSVKYIYDFDQDILRSPGGRLFPVMPDKLLEIAVLCRDISLRDLYKKIISDSVDALWDSGQR